ncbi:hypothetical protein TUBRATIS_16120 [Tubulinosema ratisbonensis]|uniref:Uncharacterized protein n=1 Tax=Tubulinosema ratisbonensis TaxID=291195 RepID=A0A437ALF6_9MICR|nr:hypothetical protein TUBRATIS_16120 [Tubulinosema ratisbonensis]
MVKETKLEQNENNKQNEKKTPSKSSGKDVHNRIIFYIFMINESFLCLLLSYTLLRTYQLISCTLFAVLYITFKISNHLLCYKIFRKLLKVTIILIRIRYFIDDFLMLCYFLVFLSVNFIYTNKILKYCLHKLELEVLTIFFIGVLTILFTIFLLSKILFNYIKDSYCGHLFNAKEIFKILIWRIRILFSIYISLFILIIFFLRKTYFIFYILVSLILVLIATGIVHKFIYEILDFDLSYFVSILVSFLFELVAIFMFIITVFNEFILATNEVDKVCYFYLFDKKAYIDEKVWAHDIINKYF